LSPEKGWRATLHSEDPAVPTRTKVRVDVQDVTRDSVLELRAAANDGMAIRIEPAENSRPPSAVETGPRSGPAKTE
jgi:hypothetical protein